MRILRIIATVDPRSGGPVEGLIRSSEFLTQTGHTTDIATLDMPTDPWVMNSAFKVFAFGPRTRIYGFAQGLVPWLRRHAASYDAVIVHGVWNYPSLAAWRAMRGSAVPYFIFTHGSLDPWHKRVYPVKDLLKQAFWLVVQGPIFRDAKCVFFTTKEERRLARKAYWGWKSYTDRVIPYGTADAPPVTIAASAEFRRFAGLSEWSPYILFLGRIHPKKGLDILVEAFSDLARGNKEIMLVIAGPDQIGWTQELKQLARNLSVYDRIIWPGMLTGRMKWAAYHGAEAFVLPSHGENFGIVVAEALACGTPVIISDKVNIWPEIMDGDAGIVCPDTVPAFSRALASFFATDDSRRDEMRRRARETFLARFEIAGAASGLMEAVGYFRN